jgi:hypothetical protein
VHVRNRAGETSDEYNNSSSPNAKDEVKMCTSSRIHAVCALCIITAQQFISSASASNVLYVFSVPNEAKNTAELVRMEGNNTVSHTSLGFNVARAASSTKMVAFGVQYGKTHVMSWNLKTGRLLSDSEANLRVSYIPLMIGVADGLTIDQAHNQVLYVGRQDVEAPRKPDRSKQVPHRTKVAIFAAVDISTGESFKIESPKGTPNLPEWSIVKGNVGTRLEDGAFAIYSGESHSFAEVKAIEGIAKEWSTFFPNIGLAKETKDGWQILSRDDLTPLDQPIDIHFEAGSEKTRRGIFKMANSDIGQWSVVRTGDDSSDYIVVDVASHSEVTRVRYPLAVTTAFRSEDGSQLLLVDDKHEKALWANPATSITSEVNISWASRPNVTPVFQK